MSCASVGAVAASSTLTACAGAGGEETSELGEPIIAGVPANGAALNAIGSVGYAYYNEYYGTWEYQPYCSGSLIGKGPRMEKSIDFQADVGRIRIDKIELT